MKQAVSFELYCYLYFLYFNILQYVGALKEWSVIL